MQEKHCPDLTRVTGELIADARLMRLNSSGLWVYCDAGEMPLARSYQYMAASKPLTGYLLPQWQGTLRMTAAAAITQYADVFTAADGKVSSTNTGIYVGQALFGASGDGSIIEVLPNLKRVPMVNTAASAVIGSSSTAEADFDKSFTIPASELKAGSILRVKAAGLVVNQNATPQLVIKLYAGTEVVATATVAAAATNDQFLIQADIVLRTIGASGTLVAAVAQGIDAAGIALGVNNKASAVEDTTSGLTIKVSGQFDASHADNTARLDILSVEHLA